MLPWPAASLAPAGAPSPGRLRLLFVTADPAAPASLEADLDDLGYDATVHATDEPPTNTGFERRHRGEGESPDRARLDCVVSAHDPPAIDALALLDRVQRTDATLPFVLFPADGSERLASDALAAGASGYVPDARDAETRRLLVARVAAVVSAARADAGYRTVFENVDIGITLRDLETTRLVDANRHFCELLGYERVEVLELDFEDLSADLPGYDSGRANDVLRDVASTPGATVEWPIRAKDGTLLWVELSARTAEIRGRDHLLVTVRDVTARRERERELELFRELVDNATDSLFILEAESGAILDANRTACGALGYEREELVGSSILDVNPTLDGRDGWRAHVDELRREGSVLREGTHVRRDGGSFPVEISSTLEPGQDREYVVGSARDISGRKDRERRLEAQNARLERFASVVSHDLRNPLNVAMGYLDLVQGATAADGEHLERVQRGLDRMDDLIDDLLELARGEQIDPMREPVLLEAVAMDAWETVHAGAATLDVDLRGEVTADRSRLGQLFENLFRNAIEHGGPDVTVRVEPLCGGFAVEDDGTGIPPEHRGRIFDSGFSTATTGTGLGLSIVAGVADAHGWTVGVTDGRDGGARFEFDGVEFTSAPDGDR